MNFCSASAVAVIVALSSNGMYLHKKIIIRRSQTLVNFIIPASKLTTQTQNRRKHFPYNCFCLDKIKADFKYLFSVKAHPGENSKLV